MQVYQTCPKILGKLREVTKLVSDRFREILGEFSENLKIDAKPWENDFGLFW